MGVVGLHRYCYGQKSKTSISQDNLKGITLAVDFSGFVYYACSQVLDSVEKIARNQYARLDSAFGSDCIGQKQWVDLFVCNWLLSGGCDLRFSNFVTSWLDNFKAANVNLHFFADPPKCFGGTTAQRRKRYCLLRRDFEKIKAVVRLNEQMVSIYGIKGQSTSSSVQANKLNTEELRWVISRLNGSFVFADRLLRQILHERHIQIETSASEADMALAQCVQRKRAFAVLSHDSDFFIMRSTRYIPFEQIRFWPAQGEKSARISARVFDSSLVASSLEIDMENLVDVALLCSNDFTEALDRDFDMKTHLDLSSWAKMTIDLDERSFLNPVQAADWVKQMGSVLDFLMAKEVDKTHPTIVGEMYQFYTFYGFQDHFISKYKSKKLPIGVDLLHKKKKQYINLIDFHGYSSQAIELLETSTFKGRTQYDLAAHYYHLRLSKTIRSFARLKKVCVAIKDSLLLGSRMLLYVATERTAVIEDSLDASNGYVKKIQLSFEPFAQFVRETLQPSTDSCKKFVDELIDKWVQSRRSKGARKDIKKRIQNEVEHFGAYAIRLSACAFLFASSMPTEKIVTQELMEAFDDLQNNLSKWPPNSQFDLNCVPFALVLMWRRENGIVVDFERHFSLEKADLCKNENITSVDQMNTLLLSLVISCALRYSSTKKASEKGGAVDVSIQERFTDGIQHSMWTYSSEKSSSSEDDDDFTNAAARAACTTFTEALKHIRQAECIFCSRIKTSPVQLKPNLRYLPFSSEIYMLVNREYLSAKERLAKESSDPKSHLEMIVKKVVERVGINRKNSVELRHAFSSLHTAINQLKKAAQYGEHNPPEKSPLLFTCTLKSISTVSDHSRMAAHAETSESSVSNGPDNMSEKLNGGSADASDRSLKKTSKHTAREKEHVFLPKASLRSGDLNSSRQNTAPSSVVKSSQLIPGSVVKSLKGCGISEASKGSEEAAKWTDEHKEPSVVTTKPPHIRDLMQTLPAFAHRERILQHIQINQVTIVQGETGCGKSTSVPQFILNKALAATQDVRIFVTQPRRIAAIELASTVARMRESNEFGESGKLGDVVGYRIGQQSVTSKTTKLTYVTNGYMMECLMHNPLDALSRITHLVLDEVHERTMDVDLLLLILKQYLPKLPNCKLILMSATMDATEFVKYFKTINPPEVSEGSSKKTAKKLKPMKIGVRLHEVENVYLDSWNMRDGIHRSSSVLDIPSFRTVKRILEHSDNKTSRHALAILDSSFRVLTDAKTAAEDTTATNMIQSIHERQLEVLVGIVKGFVQQESEKQTMQRSQPSQRGENGSGSTCSTGPCILVFLPGMQSINTVYEQLTSSTQATKNQNAVLKIYVLHSEIELEEQEAAFSELGDGSPAIVKVILATNIAESSVTIPGVTHVLNCGIEKQIQMIVGTDIAKSEGYAQDLELLMPVWCSQASTKQRAGRAGRVRPGVALHLFTETFEKHCMCAYSKPEILRKPLSRTILQLQFKLAIAMKTTPRQLLSSAMHVPSLENIKCAYDTLAAFDAINTTEEKEARVTSFGTFVCKFPISLPLCRLLAMVVNLAAGRMRSSNSSPNDTEGQMAQKKHSWLIADTIILTALLTVPDLFTLPSKYHIPDAVLYMEEMKHNLIAKLRLDHNAWSEPLSLWRLYHHVLMKACEWQTTGNNSKKSSACDRMRRQILQHFSISLHRYKALNHLISDLCSRTIKILKERLHEEKTPAGEEHEYTMSVLRGLGTYADSHRVSDVMAEFALLETRSEDANRKDEREGLLRVLIAITFQHQLLSGILDKKGSKGSPDAKKTDSVSLSLKTMSGATNTRSALVHQISKDPVFAHDLFSPCCLTNTVTEIHDPEGCGATFSKITAAKNLVDLHCLRQLDVQTVGPSRLLFPISLLHYMSDQQYSVELLNPEEARKGKRELVRFMVQKGSGLTIKWFVTGGTDKKVAFRPRSLFKMPFRNIGMLNSNNSKQFRAVYTGSLINGNTDQMMCSNCTLLPTDNELFYPILLLLCANRKANVWIYGDWKLAEILSIRINQESIVFGKKCALDTSILTTINKMRRRISIAVHFPEAQKTESQSQDDASTSFLPSLLQVFEKKCFHRIAKSKNLKWVKLEMANSSKILPECLGNEPNALATPPWPPYLLPFTE
uniref:ATPdependent RNA helicase putative n=1 Tax=Albugo laibachii Nc14 TaxID=890382 RepID=F0VZQ2_9STRA|nr:ATPdependent RNA helicase putative [Albugo laibachii Nc14]|eukprot:CCA14273.1 ATPdependent RNA helicase putative [Albugo laibachii Nc14]